VQILDRRFDVLSTRQLHDLIRLRIDVFVVEQTCAYAELDGRDLEPGTRHVWAEEAGAAVACLRVLDDGDARRIGRVCTRLDQRSRGLARALLDHVLGSTSGPLVLDAQSYLADWYRTLGFVDDGDEFIDEDGIPHVPMRRRA